MIISNSIKQNHPIQRQNFGVSAKVDLASVKEEYLPLANAGKDFFEKKVSPEANDVQVVIKKAIGGVKDGLLKYVIQPKENFPWNTNHAEVDLLKKGYDDLLDAKDMDKPEVIKPLEDKINGLNSYIQEYKK